MTNVYDYKKREEDTFSNLYSEVYPFYQTTVNQMPLILETLRGSYEGPAS